MADAGRTKRSKVANMQMPDHVPEQERPPVRHIGRWGWAGVDGLAWIACVILAIWLRFDFNIPSAVSTSMIAVALAAALVQLFVGAFAGPYAIGHERGSFEEVVELGRAALITAGIVFTALLVLRPTGFPRTTPFTAGALALGSMLALRFVLRAWRQSHVGVRQGGRRVIVFGAGEAGRQLLRAMGRTSDAGLAAVAILDDDPQKARLRVEGVRVRGTREALGAVAAQTGADTLVIALPSADAALIRDLRARADGAGLDVLVLPPISEILGGRPTTTDLRDIDLTDLLGRRPVSLDTRAIAEHIAGRTVLVTGAGGSIGSELCRQLARFGPGSLHLLDRDESGLQATQLSLTGSGLLDSDEIILADIRDLGSLRAAFVKASPDIVFHAAALKHLPLLEAHPLEAWKSNVLGTLNVLRAAAEVDVKTFVNISTDKAADPICVLGYSKRVAERITAGFARHAGGRYVSVRFGNVLGSRGSVVHAFTAQIERGGPVTVTHPDVERYFMLIPEACQLVLEAAAIGGDGEVLVLDMGEQVKIVDVATTLIQMSGRPGIDIIYSGLRAGEKLGEDLFGPYEFHRPTAHPLVSRVVVPHLDAAEVTSADLTEPADAAAWMRRESTPGSDLFPSTAQALGS